MSMRVGFAGTPEFAAAALRAILDAGHTVPLVLTQPDRPAGRGLKLQPSPVKQVALEAGLPVHQPRSLRLDGKWPDDANEAMKRLEAARLEVMVVAAYGLILPQWVLSCPTFGCLNIHASLLPRWRGAAPIHRALEAGDAQTGITIMQMDAGLDTGGILRMHTIAIGPRDTTASLHDRLAGLGADMIVQALGRLAQGPWAADPQPATGITYAHKVDKSEAPVRWTMSAEQIDRRIRAFEPFPGATVKDGDEVIKVRTAQVAGATTSVDAPPGTVVHVDAQVVRVSCGEGALDLLELQRPSATRQPAPVVARARGWRVGHRLS